MDKDRDVAKVSYYVYEGEQFRSERIIKRLTIATAISAGSLAAVCLTLIYRR